MLQVNQLSGFGSNAAPPVTPASLTFISQSGGGVPAANPALEDDTNASTYTFTSAAIGTADATRRVVVVAHWAQATNNRTLTSATIGGIAATIHQQSNPANLASVAIISALVPTGTTATIVLNFNASADRCKIGVFRSVNEQVASPNDTQVDTSFTSNALSVSLAVPQDGWVVAGSTNATGAGITHTWTGVTKQYDAAFGEAAGGTGTAGFASGLGAQTLVVTDQLSGSSTVGGMIAMSWK